MSRTRAALVTLAVAGVVGAALFVGARLGGQGPAAEASGTGVDATVAEASAPEYRDLVSPELVEAATDGQGPAPQSVPEPVTEPAGSDGSERRSPLADRVRPLGSALGVPAVAAPGRAPVALTIESLGVEGAVIATVGVDAAGEMEIPVATEVGWYGFGPAPGDAGSAVLAAHIAADGVDGVFRYLTEVEPGNVVEIVFDDASIERFEIVGLEQYDKDDLPFDDLFARSGDSRLALITCGGDFNPSLRSYEDNVVAYALPLAADG